MKKPAQPTRLALLIAAMPLVLGACAVNPVKLSNDEQLDLTRTAKEAARQGVEPLSGPLTLSEAVARAMKYNLDHRMRMLEEAQALGVLEIGKFDMLPKLLVNAGYNSRNNDTVFRSRNLATGEMIAGGPFASTDRTVRTADIGLQWNMLDFGVSYFNAQQNADRVLIAAERRRKAMHQLIQDVRTAFWRAASAEKLSASLADTIDTAEKALADASKAEAQSIRNPLESLRYQRSLLENIRLLESVQQELSTARIELANLMNLPQGTTFTIAEPSGNELFPDLMKLPIEKMEELALANNADLREQSYNRRIAVAETKKAMMKLFPGITFGFAQKQTSNSFAINPKWTEASAQINFNLFNLLSAKTILKQADDDLALTEHRRMTVQMAVLTQVHLAKQQYESTYGLFTRADSIYKVDERISKQTQNRAEARTMSELERVSSSTSAILSLLRRYQALSQVYASASRVQASLGLEPQVASVAQMSVKDLSVVMGDSMQQWAKLDSAPATMVASAAAEPKAAAPKEGTTVVMTPVEPAQISQMSVKDLSTVVDNSMQQWSKLDEASATQVANAPAAPVADSAAPASYAQSDSKVEYVAAAPAATTAQAAEPASMGLAPMGFSVTPQTPSKGRSSSQSKSATPAAPLVTVIGKTTTWTFSTKR